MESAQAWAHRCFGGVDFGDRRLNRRAVAVAGRLAGRCGRSINSATANWSEAKGGYRFLSNPKVSCEGLLAPHYEQVRSQCNQAGEYLLIEDTSSLDFTSHEALADLGWIGNGGGRGLMMHTTLAVRVDGWDGWQPRVQLLGLFDQQLWIRTQAPGRHRRESRWDRLKRARESDRWAQTLVGSDGPAPQCQWTFVADRESDIYEVLDERLEGMDYIIRSNQKRRLADGDGDIRSMVAASALRYTTQLSLRARPGRKARSAHLEVRACQVQLRSPGRPWRRLGSGGHQTWIVEVREPSPPKGVEALHWLLLTSWDCSSTETVRKVVSTYGSRWMIEEYHKALKSGTRIEAAQLKTRRRIENLFGILSVLAVRLLQAKLEPDSPIEDNAFDPALIAVLTLISKVPPNGWTNRTLLRAIAQQGGFLARKGDGEPGWITIWRGMQHIGDMAAGFKLAQKRCG